MSGIIKYGFINAKLRGLKRELLTLEKYNLMLNATYNEFCSHLLTTPYGELLKEKKGTPAPIEIEKSAIYGLFKAFQKLLRWLPEDACRFVAFSLIRYESENVKAAMRCKHLNLTSDKLRQHLVPVPLGLKIEDYMSVYEESRNLRELLRLFIIRGIHLRLEELIKRERDEIVILEAALDKMVYEDLLHQAKKLGRSDMKAVRKILGIEIDLCNVKNVLRGKNLKLSWNEMVENIIPSTYKVSTKTLQNGFLEENIEKSLEKMLSKHYSELFDKTLDILMKGGGIPDLEKEFNRYLYHSYRRLWRKPFPYDLSLVLTFLGTKWFEAKNIKIIAYGKSYGLPPEVIRKNVIY